MSLEPVELKALDDLLNRAVGPLKVLAAHQLTGGASRQTYRVEVQREADDDAGGSEARVYILQREIKEPRLAGGMADEADLVSAARAAGVPAPKVIATNRDGAQALGPSFFITEAVDGETIARPILRDERFLTARQSLAGQLGHALGTLHTAVRPADVGWLEETDEVARYREVADELDLVSPAFELGFRWLELHRRSLEVKTVVHGDFRMGNMIIGEAGLSAVIDWELGHIGDPMEDLGWVCVRAWRFGGAEPVAGVGSYEQLFAAYEEATGNPVDPVAVRWWEILGTLKWGIMCGTQGNRHLSGDVRSVELAAIGPRVAEQEYDLLGLIGPDSVVEQPSIAEAAATRPALFEQPTGVAEGGGRPSAEQLLEAVREYLAGDVTDSVEGRVRFHARVASNALATVSRELRYGPAMVGRNQDRLERLGYSSERELAKAIRAGDLDHRVDEVTAEVRASVVDRLTINNPKWLAEPDELRPD